MEPGKKVLLVGLLLKNIPSRDKIAVENVDLAIASTIEEVRARCAEQQFDIAILGAGIDLDSRLSIIEEIVSSNDRVTVHLKDRASGPEGFLPFINTILQGLAS